MFARGVNREEARMYHRQVYGGLVSLPPPPIPPPLAVSDLPGPESLSVPLQTPIDQLAADQLGAAAGYEAVRHWTTYRPTYSQQFQGNLEAEREALAGLAAGEAVKLMNYSQVPR